MHHLVAFNHRVVAGLRIGYVRYAARRARYQLVAFQQFAFGHRHCAVAVGCSVVRPALACRTNRDRHFRRLHRQRAICCFYAVVAGCSGRELVARQLVRYRALARERDAAGYHRADRVGAHQADCVIAVIAMRRSVVGELFALRGYRHGLWRDAQVARRRRDHVVRGHVLFAVHHLVAFNHRVVAGLRIGYVRYAARRARYQLVAFQQFAFGHRHCAVAVGCSVVRPALACRTNRDRHFRRLHRQRAICCFYAVVAGCSGRELVARQLVRYRALARERDAAGYHRADRVGAHQAIHIVLCPALRFTCVREFLVLRRYRYSLRIDGQLAGHRRDHVVRGHVFLTVHHLVAFSNRVVPFRRVSNVRHAARRARYQFVTSQQLARGHCYCLVRMGFSVVCPFLVCCCDRDRHCGLHYRQLTRYVSYVIIGGNSGNFFLFFFCEIVFRTLRYRSDRRCFA